MRSGSFPGLGAAGGCAEARFSGVFWIFREKTFGFREHSRFIAIQPDLTGASGTGGTVSACRVSGAFQVKPLKYLTLSQVEHPGREIQYKDIERMPQATPCGHGMPLNWPSRRAVEARWEVSRSPRATCDKSREFRWLGRNTSLERPLGQTRCCSGDRSATSTHIRPGLCSECQTRSVFRVSDQVKNVVFAIGRILNDTVALHPFCVGSVIANPYPLFAVDLQPFLCPGFLPAWDMTHRFAD